MPVFCSVLSHLLLQDDTLAAPSPAIESAMRHILVSPYCKKILTNRKIRCILYSSNEVQSAPGRC
nr:MAG TPA: hypothetical protein [Caudoviricetes sp.]